MFVSVAFLLVGIQTPFTYKRINVYQYFHFIQFIPSRQLLQNFSILYFTFYSKNIQQLLKYVILSMFRSCAILNIPENIDVLFDTEKIKRSEQHLRSTIQKVVVAIRLRELCLEDVLKVVDDAGKQLETYTDRLVRALMEFKLETQSRLDSIRDEFETDLSDQTAFLKKELTYANEILLKTTRANSEGNNKSQQFTCSCLAAMTTKKCEDANRNCDYTDVKEILFHPHKTCEKCCNVYSNIIHLENFLFHLHGTKKCVFLTK